MIQPVPHIGNPSLMPGVTFGKRNKESGRIDWTPPNSGKYPISHVDTFQGHYSSMANVFMDYDEALLDNRTNARFMRNDIGIRECLDSRQRSVALLNWHIQPEDDKSQSQRDFCEVLERVVKRISHFYEYRRNCQHAIWYGKYAINHRWGIQVVNGQSVYMPTPRHQDDYGWEPLHGDKLVFRQGAGLGTMKPGAYVGQMGVRVGTTFKVGDIIKSGTTQWKVEPTNYGLAYFLSPAERRLFLVHRHHVEDAAYEDALRSGSIMGVGIRSVIYWEWVQKQETLAFLMEFLERMAGGIQVWKYPQGNDAAYQETRKAAESYNSGEEHVLMVPVPVGDPGQYGVEVIDPGFSGVETLHSLLTDYFGNRIKRYILGQTLSSEAASTGLGSGVAELHLDTLLQILKSDATGLEETITSDLLQTIIRINVSKGVWADPGFRPRFEIETESADVDKKLEAWQSLIDRGLKFREQDLYAMVGASPPGPGDKVLTPPGSQDGAPPGAGMPPGAAPPGMETPQGDVGIPGDSAQPGDGTPKEPDQNGAVADSNVHRYRREQFRKSTIPRFRSRGVRVNGSSH